MTSLCYSGRYQAVSVLGANDRAVLLAGNQQRASKRRYTILVAGDQNSAGALTSVSTTNQVIIAKIQTALKLRLIMSTLPRDVNVKIKRCTLNTGIKSEC